MKAIGVFKYGAAANLVSKSVNEPRQPKGRELLVEYGHECSRPKWQRGANFYNIGRVKAISVNPIDVKVRKGIYDDTPGKALVAVHETHDLMIMTRLLRQSPSTISHHSA